MATGNVAMAMEIASGPVTKAGPSTATQSQSITLKGSVATVTEYFGMAINSILYQRGLYPPESFNRVKKYGLTMLMTNDDGLRAYLKRALMQTQEWLMSKRVQKLVVAITSVDTNEVVERWQFDVECHKDESNAENTASQTPSTEAPRKVKTQKEIDGEIAAIIRQITASVTFLPFLEDPCSFDLLVYTDTDVSVPAAWEESDACLISKAAEVKLRSFTTNAHKVDTLVAYRTDE